MLAKSKLDSIESLMSQALIDLEIINEEFKTVVNEKEKYEEMKENIGNITSSDEKDELSGNSRNNRRNSGKTQFFFFKFFLCIYKMVNIAKKTWGKNDIEVVVFDGIKWLNEKKKKIEVQLGHANLIAITRRYPPEYRKHRYESVNN